MSMYLEIPEFESDFRFRTFLNDGLTIVYPHVHKEIELIYAKRGKVNIGVADEIIELEEGELYIFASGQPHYFWLLQRVSVMCISLISHCLMKPFCEKRTFFKNTFDEGNPTASIGQSVLPKNHRIVDRTLPVRGRASSW